MGHAVVVHGGVDVPCAEGVQGRVVVASGLGVGADLDGQVGVVSVFTPVGVLLYVYLGNFTPYTLPSLWAAM